VRKYYSAFSLHYIDGYLGDVSDDQLKGEARVRLNEQLKHKILLNQIQILLLLSRKGHFVTGTHQIECIAYINLRVPFRVLSNCLLMLLELETLKIGLYRSLMSISHQFVLLASKSSKKDPPCELF
jgi:hypothetical protein